MRPTVCIIITVLIQNLSAREVETDVLNSGGSEEENSALKRNQRLHHLKIQMNNINATHKKFYFN